MAASWKYFGLRLVNAFVVLLVVVFIVSILFSSLAEEQLESQIADQLTAELQGQQFPTEEDRNEWVENRRQELRAQFELDKPTYIRVFYNAYDTLTLQWGSTHQISGPTGSGDVAEIILFYLPRTVLLFTTASVFYILIGLIVGLKAAQVAGSKLDKLISIFGMVASSVPMWWFGMIMILIFVYQLNWFPTPTASFPEAEGLAYVAGVLNRMALPLFTIVFVYFGARAWATRNIVTGVLQDDYIMAARAKGVPERKVIYGHTLKTAAPPIVTSAILTFLFSIGGAMITELIFNWPGLGRLLFIAISQNDVPVIMGLVFITTFLYVIGYAIADLIYGFLDPRVEVGASRTV